MGIISKLFGKKKEVKQPVKKVVKTVAVNKIEESKTTLRYDEQIITIEALRAGIRQGARVMAFRNGSFIPLKDLGTDLVIYDVEKGGYIPLVYSENPQHQDVRTYVFGAKSVEEALEEADEELELEDEGWDEEDEENN